MKLYHSPTSPYARKVRMVAIERGLEDRIEVVSANPLENPDDLMQANPLCKVPALARADGPALFDSPVICAYLDSLAGSPQLIPAEGAARWDVLRREALCDGILDAAVTSMMERRRSDAEQSQTWLGRWKANFTRALDQIEAEIESFGGDLTIDQLALGAALGYLDFRMSDLGWRDSRPATAAWFETFSARRSMQETAPPPA